ncbi:efflux RND transporter periplasmic adaptor subunit [Micromonospora sp. WMMD1102]|uniref:efflux RND transporter periplasmic adaptor subunit n=1 Tax=Micromonospora sp. WMMD1102 TaxID=3016105 RepID=UPI002415767C|nr:efflux RND transporter periplasmic adaptor subunit [Micromonospora sp. WMMD1102]MDG4791622.1 efflux RND transporter periplasmic adaptor subunit [Micromonospora sp. WMMD1102]
MRRASPPRLSAAPRPRTPVRPRRPVLSATILAATVLFGLSAASCESDQQVGLASVERADVAELVDAPASVTARAAATLSAPADGVLAELRVGPGARVRAGRVLAVVESPSARDRLAKARRARDAARAAGRGVGGGTDLSRLRRSTDRAAAQAFRAARDAAGRLTDPAARTALLAQVKVAERQYAAAAESAGAAVRAVNRGVAGMNSAVRALSAAQRLQAEQAYDLAKATVDALVLRAPIGGVVQLGGPASPAAGAGTADALAGLLGATGGLGAPAGVDPAGMLGTGNPTAPVAGVDGAVPVGGRVSAGTPILTVVDLTDLGLVAEVDETDVLLVDQGVPASVELDAATGAEYPARVRSVDVLPTTSARGGVSYRVRLSLGPGSFADGRAAPAPRPGMSAVVRLRVREAAGAVTVPAAALHSADGRDAVWVVEDGIAEQVPVTVGVQGQDLVQIVSGVEPGQQVVVSGGDQVRPGERVR